MTNSQKEKKREYDRKWREENKEKKREYDKKYGELNKEKKLEYNRKWREENKEYNRKWREENKEEIREKRSEYYQLNNEKIREERRKQHKEKRAICLEYLGGKCVVCGTTHNLQFDHIKREGKKYNIARKLSYKFDNLKEELDKCQLLCVPCHLKKTAKEWVDITHNTVPLSKLDTMP